MKSLLLALFLLCLGNTVLGCSCTGCPDFSNSEINLQWFNDHDVVFSARVDSVVSPPLNNSGVPQWLYQDVYLSTQKVYKGMIPAKVKINPPHYFSSCEFHLEGKQGKTYIFYGFILDDSTIYTHFCNGSKEMLTLAELDTLSHYRVASLKQELYLLAELDKNRNSIMSFRYTNGQSMGRGRLINGLAEGPWIYYNYDGKIMGKGNYKNGLRTGIWKDYIYYPKFNNQTKQSTLQYFGFEKGSYAQNSRSGQWTSYVDRSVKRTIKGKKKTIKIVQPYESGMYVKGQKEGMWFRKNEKGKIIDSTFYKEDVPSEINK